MLYFLVFGYTLGDRLQTIQGVPYIAFLTPGLVMFALINSAFLNTSFSLFIAKLNGSLTDILVAPLTPLQLVTGYVFASVIRGVLVGSIIWLTAIVFGHVTLVHPGYVILFMILTAASFGGIGLLVAIFATKFDHLNFFPTFLIAPLAFLGGVFYSIEMLPDPWYGISLFNPVLYLVNGLRYGIVGVSDVDPVLALAFTGLFCGLILSACWWVFKTGYRIKD